MMRRIRRPFSLCLILLLFTGLVLQGCSNNDSGSLVQLSELHNDYPGANLTGTNSKSDLTRPFRVAAAPVISPVEGYKAYAELAKYLSDYLDHPVEFVTRQSYAEVNLLMNSGDIDVAFVCTYAYVKGQRDFGMELVAAPEVGGRAEYASYIIVPRSSPVADFAHLKGKRFAFSDPMSMSGRLIPLYYLTQLNENAETFFSNHIFTYSHDKAIRAVAGGMVDAAAVDSLVYEAFAKEHPEIIQRVKIIQKSESFASPPVVVRPNLDPGLKKKIQEVFLTMDQNAAGRKVLQGLNVDRFINISDDDYNSVRVIARKVGYP